LKQGHHVCSFSSRSGSEREHKLYWNCVKRDEHFQSDPLFTEYNPGRDQSDVRHRDRANYSDHLFPYPAFHELNRIEMIERVYQISQIEFMTPPIPDISQFIDLESVQIVAYHRVVKYRRFLDEILEGKNRFWNVHRNPSFANGVTNFQITELQKLGNDELDSLGS
jgi:hypothetical protein